MQIFLPYVIVCFSKLVNYSTFSLNHTADSTVYYFWRWMLEHVKHQVEVFFSSSQKDVKISLCLEPQFVLFLLKLRWPKIRKMLPNSEIEALVRLRTLMSTIGSCTQKVMIDKSTVRGCSRRSNFVLIIPLMIIITGRGRNESELSQGSGARARGRGWGGGVLG